MSELPVTVITIPFLYDPILRHLLSFTMLFLAVRVAVRWYDLVGL